VVDRRFELGRQVVRHREYGHLVGARDVTHRQMARQVDAAEERAHIIVGRIARDFVRIADLHDAASLHDRDAVADPERLVQVVRDEHDRALVVRCRSSSTRCISMPASVDQRENASSISISDGSNRQRARQPTAAAFHRQFRGCLRANAVQATVPAPASCAARTLVLCHAGHIRARTRRLEHGAMRHQRERLEYHAHVTPAQVDQIAPATSRRRSGRRPSTSPALVLQ